jgi:hypothetical protein
LPRSCNYFSKREDLFYPRLLEVNESNLPWEEGEPYRMVKLADGNSARPLQARQAMNLTFNCANIPEVCVSVLAIFEAVESFYLNADNIVQNNMCFAFYCNPIFRSITKDI